MTGYTSRESAICNICDKRHKLHAISCALRTHGHPRNRCLGSGTKQHHSVLPVEAPPPVEIPIHRKIGHHGAYREITLGELGEHAKIHVTPSTPDPFSSYTAWREWWATARITLK